MSGTRIRLTRAELYQKVWAAPMTTVAKEFGLSAAALANACRRHNVPLPPVGHWTKIEVGHKITPPPLIPDSGGRETVGIYVRERLSPELAELAAGTPPEVEISKALSHPLALKTGKMLASGKESERKLMVPKTGTASHLLVSRQQLPRALQILSALFLALEGKGYTVSWPKDEGATVTVSVEGEAVAFSLREVIDSVRHVLTPAEQKHPWSAPRWDYKLTGRLRLSIDNLPYASGPMRSSWADGKVQILENCLGDFVVGVRVASAAIKKNRLESEERARRREEENKRREEQQRLAEEHKRKAEVVTELIENWEHAERVRTFLRAMTKCADHVGLPDEKKQEVQQVLDWMSEYAESLDPLSDLPDSIDEFVHPEKKYSWLKW
jgi:hypothetical protein